MTPSFIKVLIDGQEIPDFLDTLDCAVTHQLNQHSTCLVKVREAPGSRFFYESLIGKPMIVNAVDGEGATLELFKGVLKEADADWELNGSAELTFHGISKSYTRDTFNQSQTFNQVDITDAIQRLTGDLVRTIAITDPGPLSMIQFNETDWSYLLRLVDRFGGFTRISGGSIEVFDTFQDQGLQVAWRTENGLHKFRTTGRLEPHLLFGVNYERRSATSRQTDMEVGAAEGSEAIPELRAGALDGSANLGLASASWNRFISRGHDDFDKHLTLEAKRRVLSMCRGFGESRIPEITPGDKIEITGDIDVPGKYGVIMIKHTWKPVRGYRNEFECTPFETYLEPVAPKAERYYGPEIARVAETSPPQGNRAAMVRVNFLWEGHGDSGFIPVLTPNAGADRGFCFVPEVGDEVLVFFRGGDSNKPLILGSMWNGVDRPPLEDLHGGEYAPNDIKRLVTKSGNRLVMDDKSGQETVVLAGPNHVRVSLFDGGQTLLLHSDGDIKIHAGGTVHMRCNQFLREVG